MLAREADTLLGRTRQRWKRLLPLAMGAVAPRDLDAKRMGDVDRFVMGHF